MQLFVCKMIVVWLLVRMSLLLRNRLFPVVVVVLGGGTFFSLKRGLASSYHQDCVDDFESRHCGD